MHLRTETGRLKLCCLCVSVKGRILNGFLTLASTGAHVPLPAAGASLSIRSEPTSPQGSGLQLNSPGLVGDGVWPRLCPGASGVTAKDCGYLLLVHL